MSRRDGLFINFFFCTAESAPASAWEDCESHYDLVLPPSQIYSGDFKAAVQTIIRQHPRPFASVSATFDADAALPDATPQDNIRECVIFALKVLDSAAKRKPIDYVGIRTGAMKIAEVWDLMCQLPARIVSLEINIDGKADCIMPARVSKRMANLRELRCMSNGKLVKTYSVCSL